MPLPPAERRVKGALSADTQSAVAVLVGAGLAGTAGMRESPPSCRHSRCRPKRGEPPSSSRCRTTPHHAPSRGEGAHAYAASAGNTTTEPSLSREPDPQAGRRRLRDGTARCGPGAARAGARPGLPRGRGRTASRSRTPTRCCPEATRRSIRPAGRPCGRRTPRRRGAPLLLQRRPDRRAASRLRGTEPARGACRRPARGLARRQRVVRARHQGHGVADVGGVHGAVDGGVVPGRDRPLPSGRKGGACRGATAPMPPPAPARSRWAGP